jgi:hypothetical protein
MRVDRLLWNITLYLLSLILSVALIQHGAFFYTFPPDPALMVRVPLITYFLLATLLFVIFKVSYYAEEHGEIFR